MRIAFVTESWLPSTDGVVTRLSATVSELRRRGHDVLIVAPHGGESQFDGAEVRGVPTFSVPFIYGGKPWGLPLPRVDRYIREFRADLVHVVNPLLLGMAGVWSAQRRRIPLVASYHTDVARYASFYHLGWLRPLIWWVVRLLHSRAVVNLATSAATGSELRSRGIPRVRLWRRGVDLTLFDPARRTRPLHDEDERGTVTALYVGRIAEEKGLDRLAPLASPAVGAELVLVGDGPGREQVAQQLGDAAVTFTGTLHGEALAATYANADVFVFPSTTETLGLVLLEAMASGLPVLAADTPASREIAGNCAACRLFPPDRPDRIPALVKELLSAAPRRDLAACARQEAERWGWEAATSELLGYYSEALAAGPVPGPSRISLRQIGAFLAVGASNAVVDLGVFNLILLAAPSHEPLRLAAYNTIAIVAALVNSYLWNSRWTFRGHAARGGPAAWRQRMLFGVQALINIVVNDVALAVASVLLSLMDLGPPRVTNNVAKVVAMGSSSFISFVVMRIFVFRHGEGTGHQAVTAPQDSHPPPDSHAGTGGSAGRPRDGSQAATAPKSPRLKGPRDGIESRPCDERG